MKRTPIISVGQVYLHDMLNEYFVVAHSNQGHITFKGKGFSGIHDVDLFLEKFGPVNPTDLEEDERIELLGLINEPLLVGWVEPDEGDEE